MKSRQRQVLKRESAVHESTQLCMTHLNRIANTPSDLHFMVTCVSESVNETGQAASTQQAQTATFPIAPSRSIMRQKRAKTYRKLMSLYSLSFSFRQPYQVLGVSASRRSATSSYKPSRLRYVQIGRGSQDRLATPTEHGAPGNHQAQYEYLTLAAYSRMA